MDTLTNSEQEQLIRETVTRAFTGSPENTEELINSLTYFILGTPKMISVDFEDFNALFAGAEKIYGGIGFAEGKNNAVTAAREAVSRMKIPQSAKLKSVLMCVECGESTTLFEMREAAAVAEEICGDETQVIWGNAARSDIGSAFRVIMLAV